MIPIWTTIPAATAILCGGCILACCPNLRKFHIFISFTLIFDALFILLEALVIKKFESFYAPMYLLYTAMMLSVPFFYYFAVRFLLKEKGASPMDLWMLEIIAVFCVIAASVALSIPQSELNIFQNIVNGKPYGGSITSGTSVMLALDGTAYIFFLLEQLFVQIFCFISLTGYKRHLQDWYSNTEGKSLMPIILIFVLVAMRFLIYIGVNFFPSLSTSGVFHIIQAIMFSLFFIAIAIFSLKLEFTAEELGRMISMQNNDITKKQTAAHDVIKVRMDQLVDERFFLNPDIDLMSVSTRVHVNYKYLTDYLKSEYGETFMVYVNRLRVEYSETLLLDKSIAIPDIAEKAGFISDSTFYRNFIKTKGITPSQYRKINA